MMLSEKRRLRGGPSLSSDSEVNVTESPDDELLLVTST